MHALRCRRAVALTVFVAMGLATAATSTVLAQRARRGDVRAELARLADTCSIEIVTDNPTFPVETKHGVINGKPARQATFQSYAQLFVPEWSLYPPELVKRATLKRIVFCEELTFAEQRRGAVPDYEHDTLYLDISRGNYSPSYLRKVIHHEFFHIIDYADDGLVYEDKQWAALNPPGFKYGDGGRAAQGNENMSVLTDKRLGFLNLYSTTGVEEDKAEMFANLLVDFAYVERRTRKDEVLLAKADRLRTLLAQFCPDMNDEFWKNVRAVKRNTDRPEESEQ